jgi:hypothetical protein
MRRTLVVPEKISCEDLIHHVAQVVTLAVGDDDIAQAFEVVEVINHFGVEEDLGVQVWLVYNDFYAFGLDAFHDALNG